jgi:hypothetical protein
MNGIRGLRVLLVGVIVFLGLSGTGIGQKKTEQPGRPSLREQQANELAEMKADVAKMQSLLNQMQAVFALVGNPTSPANHELELNIDMWRVLINQMQRRIDRMEGTHSTGTDDSSSRRER